MLVVATMASASPIYPTGATTFWAGQPDNILTFDAPLTGVLTFWHRNEDRWPLDFDGRPAGSLPETFATFPGTELIFRQATLALTDVTTIGFGRFVPPLATNIQVRDFDYTPANPPAPIPEPTTMALVGMGLLAAARKRFR